MLRVSHNLNSVLFPSMLGRSNLEDLDSALFFCMNKWLDFVGPQIVIFRKWVLKPTKKFFVQIDGNTPYKGVGTSQAIM